ncbi:hypothetical protein [Devosia sp. MC521]|uniref:hypothetical protein n=1 Tax=Devosia sp. MC521 TaxID=2759954 RepID=UPI0015FB453D|nr:hypothetical protein [Devosia sp. MC521]MBJ6985920.1 hypothetical protein [Devosia sp. MC521]QMW61297.1 hypothetical protein H4N61_09845 [Devosia sp. MC521]
MSKPIKASALRLSSPLLAATAGVLIGVSIAVFTLLPYLTALNQGLSCTTTDCDPDLLAQRSMALAAWAMFAATLASIAIGGISVYLIWRTLHSTNKTVELAQESTDQARAAARTAEQALAHQQELGRSQVKCYPIVTNIDFDYRKEHPFLKVSVTNSGQTPARTPYISVNVNFFFLRGDGYPQGRASAITPAPDLAAGGTATVLVPLNYEFDRVVRAYITTNHLAVDVYGELMHTSIFGTETPYKFRYECVPIDTHHRVPMTRELGHIV